VQNGTFQINLAVHQDIITLSFALTKDNTSIALVAGIT
jgi:hypothetical protein